MSTDDGFKERMKKLDELMERNRQDMKELEKQGIESDKRIAEYNRQIEELDKMQEYCLKKMSALAANDPELEERFDGIKEALGIVNKGRLQ
jgi:uncharacterized protein with von Willebrand factor type A (vWA) domain